jgi:hypothetical protein
MNHNHLKTCTKNVTTSGQLLSISDQVSIKQNQVSLDANQCYFFLRQYRSNSQFEKEKGTSPSPLSEAFSNLHHNVSHPFLPP